MRQTLFIGFFSLLFLASCTKDSPRQDIDGTETTERVACLSNYDCSTAAGINIAGKPICFWRLSDIVAQVQADCPGADVTFQPNPSSGFIILSSGETQTITMIVQGEGCEEHCVFTHLVFTCDLDKGCTGSDCEECEGCDNLGPTVIYQSTNTDNGMSCCVIGLHVYIPPSFDCEFDALNYELLFGSVPPYVDVEVLGPSQWKFCGEDLQGIEIDFNIELLCSNGDVACSLPMTSVDIGVCN